MRFIRERSAGNAGSTHFQVAAGAHAKSRFVRRISAHDGLTPDGNKILPRLPVPTLLMGALGGRPASGGPRAAIIAQPAIGGKTGLHDDSRRRRSKPIPSKRA